MGDQKYINAMRVLSTIIPEDLLTREIYKNTNNVEVLNILIDLKIHSSKNIGEKLPNSIFLEIADKSCDYNLLLNIFSCIENPKTLPPSLIVLFISKCSLYDSPNKLYILHILLKTLQLNKDCNYMLNETHMCEVNNFILQTLSNSYTKSYILTHILTLYFDRNYYTTSFESQRLFLDDIFTFCTSVNNLEALCSIFDSLEHNFLKEPTLFQREIFWSFLAECLCSNESYLQKQSTYLLSKSVEHFKLGNLDISFLNINQDSMFEYQKVWGNYFNLLDISREKQLHLIEPSLCLLDSISGLNSLWQKALYKILLNHSQNTIVCSVTAFLLQKEDNSALTTDIIISLVMPTLNTNDQSELTTKMFKHFEAFCLKLTQSEFDCLLEEVVKISWCPNGLKRVFEKMFQAKNTVTSNVYQELQRIVSNLSDSQIRILCSNSLKDFLMNNFTTNDFTECFNMCLLTQEASLFINLLEKCNFEIEKAVLMDITDRHKNNYESCKMLLAILRFVHLERVHSEVVDIIFSNHPLLRLTYRSESKEFSFDNNLRHLLNYLSASNMDDFVSLVDEYDEMMDIVINLIKDTNISVLQATFCFKCMFSDKEYNISFKDALSRWKSVILNNKTDENLCIEYIKAYFNVYEDEYDSKVTKEIVDIFTNLLENQTDPVLEHIYQLVDVLLLSSEDKNLVLNLIDTCFTHLKNSTKSRCFKNILKSFARVFYTIEYFEAIEYDFDKILSISNELFGFYKNNNNMYHDVIVPLKVLVKDKNFKNENIPYLTVTLVEIYLHLGIDKETCGEMYHLQSLFNILTIINRNENVADLLIDHLIKRYSEQANKRYFPDSQIHLQKLSIFQLILAASPHILQKTHIKTKILHLIVNSFQTEIHQNCVKQLMQWLLILILTEKNGKQDEIDSSLDLIKKTINMSDKTKPSSVTSLIPVLYHVTMARPTMWKETIELLQPWSMGAQFKLRVYSQIAIKNLIENLQKTDEDPYRFILNSVNACIEASGSSFYNTLKTDIHFFNNFNPERDLSIETIYLDIPRLNKVFETNLRRDSYQKEYDDNYKINKRNKNRSLSQSIDKSLEEAKSIKKPLFFFENDELTPQQNIQLKVTPWKSNMVHSTEEQSNCVLIASLISKPQNLGGLMRTCEVLGLKKIVLHDAKIVTDKEFKSLSMSSEGLVGIEEVKINDLKEYLLMLKQAGYSVIAAEQTSESVSLDNFKFPLKTAILLGNEKEGIPANLLPLPDFCLEIPQFGYVRSLNVHVAGAMFMWEYAKQHFIK